MPQCEVDDDLRFHLCGTAIQERGLVSPAPNCVQSSVHQQRVTADYGQTFFSPSVPMMAFNRTAPSIRPRRASAG